MLLGAAQAGWMALASALVVMIASRFTSVIELSLGPLSAKLAARVDEADLAMNELRQLSLALSRPMVTIAMRTGRLGTVTDTLRGVGH